jgi:hypothetical protein
MLEDDKPDISEQTLLVSNIVSQHVPFHQKKES